MKWAEKRENGEIYWQGKYKNFKVVVTELIKERVTKYVVNILHMTDDIKYHSYGIAEVEQKTFRIPQEAGAFAQEKIDSFLSGNDAEWFGKDVRLPEGGINEDDSDFDHDANYEKGGATDGKIQS